MGMSAVKVLGMLANFTVLWV